MKIVRRRTAAGRGFALMTALFVMLVLLAVALVMLTASQFVSNDTRSSELKNQAFNAAEAGINDALDKLNGSFSNTSGSGSVGQNYAYAYTVAANPNSSATTTTTDPATGNTVSLPPNSALVSSTGKGPLGERPATVEVIAIKPPATQYTFPNYAVVAGLDIDLNWNSGSACAGFTESSAGAHDANLYANGNIPANACYVEGSATAHGTVTGNIASKATPVTSGAPEIRIPTNELALFVAAEKTIAQQGGACTASSPIYPSCYIGNGQLPSSYNCPTGSSCVLFIDGSVSISKGNYSITGDVTVVVNGNFQSSGNANLTFQSNASTKSLFVVNGNANVGGNGNISAELWSKGDTILHGDSSVIGAIVAGGNVHLQGGGQQNNKVNGFTYDKFLQGLTITLPSLVKIKSYAEY